MLGAKLRRYKYCVPNNVQNLKVKALKYLFKVLGSAPAKFCIYYLYFIKVVLRLRQNNYIRSLREQKTA